MRGGFLPGRENEFVGNVAVALAIAAICGWPWFVAFYKAATPSARVGANIFSFAAAGAAAAFYSPIRTAPSEGVGYYVILFVLVVWIGGPFLLRIRGPEEHA